MHSAPARPAVVCVTPVRNEEWIIERFLRAAELWADHIVIADQGSTDSTAEIARRFPKVEVLDNTSSSYDEGARQRMLLDAARRIPGPRVIVALDADEFLTPDWRTSAEWMRALSAPAGTVLNFDWVNVLPDARRAWIPSDPLALGYVDDGTAHEGEVIHATRIPVPDGSHRLRLQDVKVLHMQYTDWPRMKSKQRWYQCWEALNNPGKRPIQIYRQYHRMDAFPPHEVADLASSWLEHYRDLGIDLTPRSSGGPYWWDRQVLDWMLEHGPSRFRRLDVWDEDWERLAREAEVAVHRTPLRDPRNQAERHVHRWLGQTQERAEKADVRWRQRALIPLGW